MKLLIHDEYTSQDSLDNGDDCIKYNVLSSLEELDAISQNSCKEITFVEDVLSSIKYQASQEVLEKIATKCRSCLLYTSPSPRDVEESRMPSSA